MDEIIVRVGSLDMEISEEIGIKRCLNMRVLLYLPDNLRLNCDPQTIQDFLQYCFNVGMPTYEANRKGGKELEHKKQLNP